MWFTVWLVLLNHLNNILKSNINHLKPPAFWSPGPSTPRRRVDASPHAASTLHTFLLLQWWDLPSKHRLDPLEPNGFNRTQIWEQVEGNHVGERLDTAKKCQCAVMRDFWLNLFHQMKPDGHPKLMSYAQSKEYVLATPQLKWPGGRSKQSVAI